MRKLLCFGVMKAGKIIEQASVQDGKLVYEKAIAPRDDKFMVPVIRQGIVIGYQNLFGSDISIYTSINGEVK